jgi:hypothetical protein
LDGPLFRKSENVISGGYTREFYRSGTSGIKKGYKKDTKKPQKAKNNKNG